MIRMEGDLNASLTITAGWVATEQIDTSCRPDHVRPRQQAVPDCPQVGEPGRIDE